VRPRVCATVHPACASLQRSPPRPRRAWPFCEPRCTDDHRGKSIGEVVCFLWPRAMRRELGGRAPIIARTNRDDRDRGRATGDELELGGGRIGKRVREAREMSWWRAASSGSRFVGRIKRQRNPGVADQEIDTRFFADLSRAPAARPMAPPGNALTTAARAPSRSNRGSPSAVWLPLNSRLAPVWLVARSPAGPADYVSPAPGGAVNALHIRRRVMLVPRHRCLRAAEVQRIAHPPTATR